MSVDVLRAILYLGVHVRRSVSKLHPEPSAMGAEDRNALGIAVQAAGGGDRERVCADGRRKKCFNSTMFFAV